MHVFSVRRLLPDLAIQVSIAIALFYARTFGWLVVCINLVFYVPLNTYGHMETGPRFKPSTERVE